jgi:hypothetical protein
MLLATSSDALIPGKEGSKCVSRVEDVAGQYQRRPYVVGCVIVGAEGVVVGEGFHPKAGEPHAEVFALRAAGVLARGATAYVSLGSVRQKLLGTSGIARYALQLVCQPRSLELKATADV